MSEENKTTWQCCYCLQEKRHVFEKIVDGKSLSLCFDCIGGCLATAANIIQKVRDK